MTTTNEINTQTVSDLTKFEAEKLVGLSIAAAVHFEEVPLPTDIGFERLVETNTKSIVSLQFGRRIPKSTLTSIHFLDTMLAHLHTGEAPDAARDYGSQENYICAAREIAKSALLQAEVTYPGLVDFRMHFLRIFDVCDPRLDPAQPELPFVNESSEPSDTLFRVA